MLVQLFFEADLVETRRDRKAEGEEEDDRVGRRRVGSLAGEEEVALLSSMSYYLNT